MTSNQIAYQQSRENMRHNLAMEALTAEKNARDYQIAKRNARETKRSNLAREAEASRSNLARELETNRTNVENEAIKHMSNITMADHYSTMDDNQLTSIMNDYRIRRASLKETKRSNKASEKLRAESNDTAANKVTVDALSKVNPIAGAAYSVSGQVMFDRNSGRTSNAATGFINYSVDQLTPVARDIAQGLFKSESWSRPNWNRPAA